MWAQFFRFDLRLHLREPLWWICTVVLAVVGFLAAGNSAFHFASAIASGHLNAPFMIAIELCLLSIAALFLTATFIAGAVLRDTEVGIVDMLYATPMRKWSYLTGRFLAGLAACLIIYAVVTLAMMAGATWSSADAALLGPFSPGPYLWSVAVFAIPNLFIVAALLMLLATVTHSMLMVYTGALAFTVLWAVAGLFVSDSAALSILLDPFGMRALLNATRYFSLAQRNTELPSLSGLLLWNRVVWLALSAAMLAATLILFKPQRAELGRYRNQNRRTIQPNIVALQSPIANLALARHAARFDRRTALLQTWQILRFETKWSILGLPFLVMLLLALANFFANEAIGGMRFDAVPYPLTRVELADLAAGFSFVLPLVLLFYCGELVHRARQVNIAELSDALPIPQWTPLVARSAAVVAIVLTFLLSGDLAAIAIQLYRGGAPIDSALYLVGTLTSAAGFILMGLGMLAVQTALDNRFAGYLASVLLLLSGPIWGALGLPTRMLNIASLPPLLYSDLNGYGQQLRGWRWFVAYWALFDAALLLAAAATPRGRVAGLRHRLRSAVAHLRGPSGVAIATVLAMFAGCGAWIFFNTHIVNTYRSQDALLDAKADYEKRYRPFLLLPNPDIVRMQVDVDIFPAAARVAIKGHYLLKNRTAAPLDTLRVQLDTSTQTRLDLPGSHIVSDDPAHGMRIIHLAQALAPNATLDFNFTVDAAEQGFTESGAAGLIHTNGTAFTSENFFPKFGYVQANEIEDVGARRVRGLGAAHRAADLDDVAARSGNYLKQWGFDTGLMDFETTVSTSADQIAIAPGHLETTWVVDDRRYFRYRAEHKVLPFLAYQSGRWSLRRDNWNGVPIEVYADPKHLYNVDNMIRGARRALDYYTTNFGPYPNREVRIVEVPLYQTVARSFPGTIPFSESLGFINDVRAPNTVDHVFYITAHELAHQWWGDQAIAANVQGSGMLVESLAEYSALMVLEHAFGREMTAHVLRYDRDAYLAGRGKALVAEQPLYRSDNQVHVEYRKGSLVFYRLRNEIGEKAVNLALRKFLDTYRYGTAPYPVSSDLLTYIRAEAPPEKQQLITDLFERIVLYDNHLLNAYAHQRSDGKWAVTLQLSLAKIQADGTGVETSLVYNEPVEIVLYADQTGAPHDPQRELYHARHNLPAGASSVTVIVDQLPKQAALDPYRGMILKSESDSRRSVTSD